MSRNRRINLFAHTLLFIAAICLYTLTLNPDVQPADSGEFQIAAIMLGIPHPPGYPLFTMLGWLFAQVPIGSPFARVSFLSVIVSAFTLVLISLTVQRISKGAGKQGGKGAREWGRVGAGLLAAIALGTSTTFWAQATTTNIRSLTAFFTALMLYALAQVADERRRTDEGEDMRINRCPFAVLLSLFALALGLGVGHHVSLIFVGVVFGLYVLVLALRSRAPLRVLGMAALALLGTQLVWLYLPIRDAVGARFAPGNLGTIDGLLYHIFARGFAGDMLAFAAPEFLWDRLAALPTLLAFEFSLPVLLAAAVALLALLWRRRTVGLVLLLAFTLHMFITITYRAPQTVEYAMPAWVILCVTLGAGGAVLIDALTAMLEQQKTKGEGRMVSVLRLSSSVPWILLASIFIVLARDGLGRLPSFIALAQDRSTRALAEGVLENAAPGSTVLSQWHQATPMWALQDVEGRRRDVRVDYVYPQGAQPYAETFAERARESVARGPTYVTSYYPGQYAAHHLTLIPQHSLSMWEVFAQPQIHPGDAGPGNLLFDGRVEVFMPRPALAHAEVGQALNVIVSWRALAPIEENESLTFRIMRGNGRLATNADIRLDPAMQVGEVRTQRLALGIPLDLTPAEYPIMVGAYRADAAGLVTLKESGGADFAPAVSVAVTPASQSPVTQHAQAQNTSNGATLIGVDYDTAVAGQLRLFTHWQLSMMTATVALQDADGNVLASPQVLPSGSGVGSFFTLIYDAPPTRQLHLTISTLPVQSPTSTVVLPDFADGERYVPFANQMVLVGADLRHEGSALKVDLQWLSARAITTDYVVSARVEAENFYAQHDGVPALGTLPTLKWIRGSRVMDRHPIDLDGYAGVLRPSVIVYDAFTQQPLPMLDGRN